LSTTTQRGSCLIARPVTGQRSSEGIKNACFSEDTLIVHLHGMDGRDQKKAKAFSYAEIQIVIERFYYAI
jgi:hypothetical protein